MKILSSKEIYNADRATLKSQNISSIELMERASVACYKWIENNFISSASRINVFCGVGNNGGDGLVITRLLIENGYDVSCYIVNFSNRWSDDFRTNYNKLLALQETLILIEKKANFPEIEKNSIVIDAIFGIGLSRSVDGFTADLISHLNESRVRIISIDIPSGLYADKANLKLDVIIEAFQTLTFQQPKLAFLLPENEEYIGNWEVLNIGLDAEFIESLASESITIEKGFVQSIYKRRKKFSHKGSFGHSLIIGGSFGKIGAVTLASKAALQAGSGLVTTLAPKCGYEILQIAIPEIMVEVDEENALHLFNYKSLPTVIGIGPGMGTSENTMKGFTKFLEQNSKLLVLDADALNLLSRNRELLKLLPKDSILTPHPKELERLIGSWDNDYHKLEITKEFSIQNNVIVVLKGANTVIVDREQCYFNTTGNPALATAGSGDVLMGIITGLLAQGYEASKAAILGVYIHGLTANLGCRTESVESFRASNILDYLGMAFKSIGS